MSVRQAAVLASPGVLVLLGALPFALAYGQVHLLAAAVGVGLTIPPAYGTFGFTKWLAGRHPLGGVIGMLVGTMIRILIAVGGGTAVFLLTPELRSAVLVFWFWLLFAYLSSLVAETVLLVGQSPLIAGGATGGKG